jgi:hypothetical protein
MKPDYPLVMVRWEDSRQPLPGWQLLADLDVPATCECRTVGWLIKDEPSRKVLAQSVGGDEEMEDAQAGGIMVIPARCVLSIEPLATTSASSDPSDPQSGSEPRRTPASAASA